MNQLQPVTRKGYDYLYTEDGTIAVDLETGEAADTLDICIPVGSHIITPQAQRHNEEYKRKRAEYLKGKEQADKLGRFNFVQIYNDFEILPPSTRTRLIYLSTYLCYNSKALRIRGKPITITNLHEVLGLSPKQTKRFITETREHITCDSDGNLYLEGSCFVFGNMLKGDSKTAYQKIYLENIRRLYRSVPRSKDKHLGYVFLMLPYINKEHNVLCYNIYERELSEMETMSIKEFCQIIGYSTENAAKLIMEYSKITFPVEGRQERFCAFVTTNRNLNEAQIIINPHVIYNGSNKHLVEILSIFCKG